VTASGEAEDGAPAPAAREVVVTACRGAHGCGGAPVVEALLAQTSLVRFGRDAADGHGSWELRAALEAAAAAVAMAGRSALPMAGAMLARRNGDHSFGSIRGCRPVAVNPSLRSLC
jgi:hypothetical protein